MTRYFFHLEGASGVLRDDTGEELEGVEHARSHAIAVARALARARIGTLRTSRLLVADSCGAILFRIPLIDHDSPI